MSVHTICGHDPSRNDLSPLPARPREQLLSQPLRSSSIEVKTERTQLGMTNHKRSATLIIAGTRLDKGLAGALGTVVRPPFPASGSGQHAHLDVDLSSIGRGYRHAQDRNSVLADTLRTRLAHLLPPAAPPRRLPSRDRLSIPLQATSNLILTFCFRVFFRSRLGTLVHQVRPRNSIYLSACLTVCVKRKWCCYGFSAPGVPAPTPFNRITARGRDHAG